MVDDTANLSYTRVMFNTELELKMENQVIAMWEDGYTDEEIARAFNLPLEEVESILDGHTEDTVDDGMDGDFDSAMASAGYGTDEDYGLISEMDDY